MPEIDRLPPLRDVIATHGLAAKKSLGQNFLFDLNLTRKIARAAGAIDGGVFYEVGPGPGGLTRALLSEGAGKVIAVERDARCLPALEEIARAWPGKLQVICADALELDELAILPKGVRVAANLPYNVGTAILIKWLTAENWPPVWGASPCCTAAACAICKPCARVRPSAWSSCSCVSPPTWNLPESPHECAAADRRP